MPLKACSYPFKRLIIDHYIRGNTRVQWELQPTFNDPQPHTFQLQVGRTANNDANDWEDVGTAATDATVLDDDEQRLEGKRLITHYRVKLTTPVQVYFSDPTPVYGELDKRDWRLAREIVRKEALRHQYATRPGILLKRRRFGVRCETCRDPLTDEINDSNCKECHGTGYEVGYHTPLTMQMFDLSPEPINADREHNRRGTIRDVAVRARILGTVQVNKHDVWVDPSNDQRWVVDKVKHVAEMKGWPLVVQVILRLAPYTHPVYKVEVGEEPADLPGPYLPTTGSGSVDVDHDFGGTDNLVYETAGGDPIVGATIEAFTATDFNAGRTSDEHIVAQTTTTANGRWLRALSLDPGDYVLRFSKTGKYGPDTTQITVPVSSSSSISSVVSSSSS